VFYQGHGGDEFLSVPFFRFSKATYAVQFSLRNPLLLYSISYALVRRHGLRDICIAFLYPRDHASYVYSCRMDTCFYWTTLRCRRVIHDSSHCFFRASSSYFCPNRVLCERFHVFIIYPHWLLARGKRKLQCFLFFNYDESTSPSSTNVIRFFDFPK